MWLSRHGVGFSVEIETNNRLLCYCYRDQVATGLASRLRLKYKLIDLTDKYSAKGAREGVADRLGILGNAVCRAKERYPDTWQNMTWGELMNYLD